MFKEFGFLIQSSPLALALSGSHCFLLCMERGWGVGGSGAGASNLKSPLEVETLYLSKAAQVGLYPVYSRTRRKARVIEDLFLDRKVSYCIVPAAWQTRFVLPDELLCPALGCYSVTVSVSIQSQPQLGPYLVL